MTCDKCILSAEGVSFSYGEGPRILQSIDLCIAPGELLVLLGPNGAGKSTLLNCLVGACAPQEGRVVLDGQDMRGLQPREVARSIAYVPQSSLSAYGYQVRDYIAMGRAPHKNVFQHPNDSDYRLVSEAMDRLGVGCLAEKPYTQLSGGERQMVNVCRAMVQQPRVILFDEPTSALDYGNQVKVLSMVKDLSEQGYAIIMTTHNPDQPILLGGRVAVLDRSGSLVSGSVSSLITTEVLSALYQVDLRVLPVDGLNRSACLPAAL